MSVILRGAGPCSKSAVKSAMGGWAGAGGDCWLQPIANDNKSKTTKTAFGIDSILILITMKLNSLLSKYEFAILFP
jgi:hypothetical protein